MKDSASAIGCGGLAGTIMWSAVLPLDVAKTRIQTAYPVRATSLWSDRPDFAVPFLYSPCCLLDVMPLVSELHGEIVSRNYSGDIDLDNFQLKMRKVCAEQAWSRHGNLQNAPTLSMHCYMVSNGQHGQHVLRHSCKGLPMHRLPLQHWQALLANSLSRKKREIVV